MCLALLVLGADRLAQPEGDWQPFQPTGVVGSLYEKMAALVRSLEDYQRQLARRPWRTPEGKLQRPTVNLGGVFHCGEGAKINTVPALAKFSIDRRVLAICGDGGFLMNVHDLETAVREKVNIVVMPVGSGLSRKPSTWTTPSMTKATTRCAWTIRSCRRRTSRPRCRAPAPRACCWSRCWVWTRARR